MMQDFRSQAEKIRDRRIGLRAEEVAAWYFRLNGFLSLPGFIVHLDQDKADVSENGIPRYQRTEADLIGVRFIQSIEIINAFGNKRAMIDDSRLTELCKPSDTKQALFVLVEVKAGICKMNGPWTNKRKENMQRVIRRLGFALDEMHVEKIAAEMYDNGRYEDDFYVLQYICIGSAKSSDIKNKYNNVVQIDWVEIGEFLIDRFISFPEKTPDGQVHEQWPEFGRKFGKWISDKKISSSHLDIKPSSLISFIRTGEFI